MADILITAEDYAFGPVGKALTVAPILAGLGHRTRFMGYGTAYELARKEPTFDDVIEYDVESARDAEPICELIASADMLLSSMDKPTAQIAYLRGVNYVWLDILFFWRNFFPNYVLEAPLFIKQDIISDVRNVAEWGPKISNLHAVGPIFSPIPLVHKDLKESGQLIVVYGGMEATNWYQVGRDSHYPFTMTRLLLEAVDTSRFDSIVFTGSERILAELSRIYSSPRVRFSAMPHHDFLDELDKSAAALVVGGVESTYEAFMRDIPVVFLPPSNGSQYVITDGFRRLGTAEPSINFSDYFPDLTGGGERQRIEVHDFLQQLRVFEQSESVLDDVANRLSRYLGDMELLNRQREAQRRLRLRCGDNGLERTVDLIDSCARGSR